MSQAPCLPLDDAGDLPPLPLLLRWLEAIERSGARRIALPHWMPGNGCLPDLLALTRIHEVHVPSVRTWPNSFRWWGCAGSGPVQVRVGPYGKRGGPDHRGEVPLAGTGAPPSTRDLAVRERLALARLEDAAALLAGGPGADWTRLVDALANTAGSAPPPLLARGSIAPEAQPRAWNPLPCARRATVALPLPPAGAPWALADERGARHPVQVVEGPVGTECLTGVEFEALGHHRFTALEDPVDACHWEVRENLLDNGRVRAEFDAEGALRLLCVDGRFTAWRAPALAPRRDDAAIDGETRISVLEDGPVRARLVVQLESALGVLSRTYTLYAGESLLHVSCSWQGEDPAPELLHPSAWSGADLDIAHDLGGQRIDQRARADRPQGQQLGGVLACSLGGDDFQAGLGLAFAHPHPLHVADGCLRLPVTGHLRYALGDPAGSEGPPRSWAQRLAVSARATDADMRAAPLRWVAEGTVLAHWARRLPDGRSEWCFAEHAGRAARLFLYPAAHDDARHADLVAVTGESLGRLRSTPEGDGWQMDLAGWQPVLVAW